MEKSIEVSKEDSVVIAISAGKVTITNKYEGKYGFVNVEAGVSIKDLLTAIAKSTDNTLDDKAVEILNGLIDKL